MTIRIRAEVASEVIGGRLREGMLKDKVGSGMKSSCRFVEPNSLLYALYCVLMRYCVFSGGQLSEISHGMICAII